MAAAAGVLPGRSPQTAAVRQRAGLAVSATSGHTVAQKVAASAAAFDEKQSSDRQP